MTLISNRFGQGGLLMYQADCDTPATQHFAKRRTV